MVPVEYVWLTLWVVFGVIGMVRGPAKELGVTTILLLSLFALYIGWTQVGTQIVSTVQGRAEVARESTIMAVYYSVSIVFIAFISYEGIVLRFPIKAMRGLGKGVFGFAGGLVNGYLIVGTVWDAVARANYFLPDVSVVSGYPSQLHSTIVQYLPLAVMDRTSPIIFLVAGMILLLALVFK
jgi:uncharacterized membrane protein required for colicin V production